MGSLVSSFGGTDKMLNILCPSFWTGSLNRSLQNKTAISRHNKQHSFTTTRNIFQLQGHNRAHGWHGRNNDEAQNEYSIDQGHDARRTGHNFGISNSSQNPASPIPPSSGDPSLRML